MLLVAAQAVGEVGLESGFADPPDSARPHVWWHWMNGHVSKEGTTKDLEALKDAGIGGALKAMPEWVEKGEDSPTGRKTFMTWHHWKKDSALLPSGLLGPVVLRFGEVTPLD